ncbi:hypothetical protein [Rhizobium lusitanum]|uniref:Uncharacterized protein n=1 Tax=Rhizobium lusitanum TaxID=293958 RepID=A0A7X0MF81_9HYPH|nr:hypothetical protein [Rhizobium lusitanum]MBB6486835.1 hypothetical protein [Rhizobium lusitanum]
MTYNVYSGRKYHLFVEQPTASFQKAALPPSPLFAAYDWGNARTRHLKISPSDALPLISLLCWPDLNEAGRNASQECDSTACSAASKRLLMGHRNAFINTSSQPPLAAIFLCAKLHKTWLYFAGRQIGGPITANPMVL